MLVTDVVLVAGLWRVWVTMRSFASERMEKRNNLEKDFVMIVMLCSSEVIRSIKEFSISFRWRLSLYVILSECDSIISSLVKESKSL